MSSVTVKVILQDIKKLETEALIVGFYEDVRPLKGVAGELDWLLCGALSSLVLTKKLRGSLGDVALAHLAGQGARAKDLPGGVGTPGRVDSDNAENRGQDRGGQCRGSRRQERGN